MVSQLAKYFSVFILSTVKFIGGPISGVATGLTWVETAIFTALGMMTSVIVFSFLGKPIKAWFSKRFGRKRKLFTPRNRRLVRVWKKYGLVGVAFLTPLILTPIGGTAVAVAFGESRGRILVHMLISAVFWAIIFSLAVYEFDHLILHRR